MCCINGNIIDWKSGIAIVSFLKVVTDGRPKRVKGKTFAKYNDLHLVAIGGLWGQCRQLS